MTFNRILPALIILFSISLVDAATIDLKPRFTCADGSITSNEACCFLFPIVDDIQQNMLEGECSDEAHAALRLIFNDAIGISPTLGGGGADGSIFIFQDIELQDPANEGIDEGIDIETPFIQKYSSQLSVADFIQLAGAVSLSNCPGAPQVPFFLGRTNATEPAPGGLIPNPYDDIDTILARFAEVGFSPAEVVAAVAAHSIADADDIDPTIPGTPFDSTPSTFDSQLFVEVQLRGTLYPGIGPNPGEALSAVPGELRLQSDDLLARDSRTACTWQSFVLDHTHLQTRFRAAVLKLSLLGQNQADLVDCSDVVPPPLALEPTAPTFPPGLSNDNIEQACATSAFPTLSTQPGQSTIIPIVS